MEKYGSAWQTTDDNIIRRMRTASWKSKVLCNATGRELAGHQLATTWAKVLGHCCQMTTEVDLLEVVAIRMFTVESS